MGVRISRLLNNVFGSQGVQPRKDDTDRDPDARDYRQRQQKQSEQDEQLRQDAQDPQKVQKAIEALKSEKDFSLTGLQIEIIQTPIGLQVKLSQADGKHLRTIPAEEFLRLKDSSSDDKAPRGKLVDHKF